MKLSRDGWGGLVVFATSLSLFWATLGLHENPLVPIGPGFYPRIVLGITGVLSLWLVLADLRATKAEAGKNDKLNYALVVLQFAIFGAYVGALHFLGFRVATALYVAAANGVLEPPRGPKGWSRVLVLAVLTAFLSHLIFERYLLVLLPRGSWTGF